MTGTTDDEDATDGSTDYLNTSELSLEDIPQSHFSNCAESHERAKVRPISINNGSNKFGFVSSKLLSKSFSRVPMDIELNLVEKPSDKPASLRKYSRPLSFGNPSTRAAPNMESGVSRREIAVNKINHAERGLVMEEKSIADIDQAHSVPQMLAMLKQYVEKSRYASLDLRILNKKSFIGCCNSNYDTANY